ncbi:hypothetical protein C7W88_07690 [Novosphingobium sp. THN1]|nr:hypothetical protein C7W88_07690 [Novosphingobium sp. THN1]
MARSPHRASGCRRSPQERGPDRSGPAHLVGACPLMAGFVLIHGSWHGGWCFDPVAEILRARGHTVVAPTLPGMGGTAEEMAAVTLDRWGDFAAQHCRDLKAQGVGPVVLGGHSRGGLVVSTAAERDPSAMDAIVYICAMMLPAGMSRAEFKELEGPNPPSMRSFPRFTAGSRPSSTRQMLHPSLRKSRRQTSSVRRWQGSWPNPTRRVRRRSR